MRRSLYFGFCVFSGYNACSCVCAFEARSQQDSPCLLCNAIGWQGRGGAYMASSPDADSLNERLAGDWREGKLAMR